jgi:hypothetical protein
MAEENMSQRDPFANGSGQQHGSTLQDDPTALRAQLLELQAQVQKAKEDAQARQVLLRDVRRLREKCEQADIEVGRLQRQLANVHNTISFRLGHALIESSKSLSALRALPVVLRQLRRDALDRRSKKNSQTG